jgi:hypothetical protein
LLRRIRRVNDDRVRHALLTVFSDILRYQNMLCRYDTYALKGQDIFAVHGFPVGLNQCEANLLGIPGVGAGGFRHFIDEYRQVTRILYLAELGRRRAASHGSGFQTVACIDGRGFGIRRRDMENLLLQLEGKVFTLNTLDALVEHTEIHKFVTKP